VTANSHALPLPPGKIVVTGATGFIGTSLLRSLSSIGRRSDVVAVSRRGPYSTDLRKPDAVQALIRDTRPAVLFHLAGLIDSANLDNLYASNVASTQHLLEATLTHVPACRVVVPGSAAEYGRVPEEELPISEERIPAPLVPYGLAKAWQSATTQYFAARGANAVVARLFNLVGIGTPTRLSVGAFAQQLRRIKEGEEEPRVVVGNLTPRRDFIDVADACGALLALAATPGAMGTFNVCRGSSVSMREVLDMMIRESGLDVEVAVDDARLRHRGEIPDSVGNPTRLHAATGWRPLIPLEESLAGMLVVPSAAH
jgi:GDP-4-dehydro-6-deoxy-D-mannose reductase